MISRTIILISLILFGVKVLAVKNEYNSKNIELLRTAKQQSPFQRQYNTNYYITTTGSSTGTCSQSVPCGELDYVLETFISLSGGDILINSGDYNLSYSPSYTSVTFSISGMTGSDGGSINVNDFDTYPLIMSVNTASSSLFYIYSAAVSTFKYLRFTFSELSFSSQRIFGSFFFFFFPFLINF
jgi:hypothetical protein